MISVYKQTEHHRYTKDLNITLEIYSNGILLTLQICSYWNNSSYRPAVLIVCCLYFYRIKQQYTANVFVLGTKRNRYLSLCSQAATCSISCELSLHVLCRDRVNQFALFHMLPVLLLWMYALCTLYCLIFIDMFCIQMQLTAETGSME
jgi:hypothetical protein